MKKIDEGVIVLFDRGTTVVQRRGWLPLNTLIMGTECLFWSTGVAGLHVGVLWSILFLLMAGLSLHWAYERWREAHGYWDDHRKAQRLNAEALRHRETRYLMRLWLMGLVALAEPLNLMATVISDGALDGLRSLLNTVALISVMYLRCCRYLGPGDFAREKRTFTAGAQDAPMGAG